MNMPISWFMKLKNQYKKYNQINERIVEKITGSVDNPKEAILRFKNEKLPNIVVTVDLLTTGVDIEKISNLVFKEG